MSPEKPARDRSTERAQPETFRAKALAASLTVKDLAKSLAWYRDVLGFMVRDKYEREGVLRAVALRAGAVEIVIGQDDGAKGMDRVKGQGMSLQFTTGQDIDALAQRVKARGGTLASGPEDAYGARVFRVKDPDGFMLVISSER